jgi:glycosyltransferase involved in cell wall biosynthesis
MPTYNRASKLEELVRPLLAQPLLELVVVVDGSEDGSIERLEAIADPRLKPLWIENRGEMGARQAGAEAASGELVLFVDDDVLAGGGLVSGHACRHADRERLVVVGYMPVRVPARRRAGDFATWMYAREYERHCELCEREPGRALTHLWGGNFSMRRGDCLEVGLRNPRYRERYHPDREFGLRCVRAGLEGVFDRSLRAEHLHERPLQAFVRDARSQGAARVLLHGMYPEMLGPPESFEAGLPAPGRLLVRLSASRSADELVSRALRALVAAAGRAHWWWGEDVAARLLRRVEQQRGALGR